MKNYGIWITTQWWATIDGGDDEIGTREEMEAKATEYTRELLPGQIVKYEVRPYTVDEHGNPENSPRAEMEAIWDSDLSEAEKMDKSVTLLLEKFNAKMPPIIDCVVCGARHAQGWKCSPKPLLP